MASKDKDKPPSKELVPKADDFFNVVASVEKTESKDEPKQKT